MKYKIFWLVVLRFMLHHADAQQADSVFVAQGKSGWIIPHKVLQGENVFTISRRYHVPPAIFADMNKLSYKDIPRTSSYVIVPVAAFNFMNTKPVNRDETRPLYYRASKDEDLSRISKLSQTSYRNLQQWNNIQNYNLQQGAVLLVGWVLYDATIINNVPPNPSIVANATAPVKINQPVVKQDTIKPIVINSDTTSEIEKIYLHQTNNEQDTVRERGAAAFFNMPVSSGKDYYYAFYNDAPKGTIIRVFNPGNNKTVFVKVLGTLPNTKQYYNCIIGISNRAKTQLGALEDKVWCELTYGKIKK